MGEISKKELSEYLSGMVKSSVARHGFHFFPGTDSYLVNTLVRIASRDELFKVEIIKEGDGESCNLEPITFQFLELADRVHRYGNAAKQKNLGDHCLILTGFFYDFIRRNGLGQVKYHANVGMTAYENAAESTNHAEEQRLYGMLARQFFEQSLVIADIQIPERPLQAVDALSERLILLHDTKVIKLYEKWLETDDRFYYQLLRGRRIKPKRINKDMN